MRRDQRVALDPTRAWRPAVAADWSVDGVDDEFETSLWDDADLFEEDAWSHDGGAAPSTRADSFETIATMLARSALIEAENARTRAAPPTIAFGDATTASREAQVVGQLGHFGNHGWEQRGVNVLGPRPGRQGLAVVDPSTGRVTYTVYDPATSYVLFRRIIGTVRGSARDGGQALEDYVRRRIPALQRRARAHDGRTPVQPFRRHNAAWHGPDLVPR